MLKVWYLRRADDAYTGTDGKGTEKKPSDWLQIGRLAVRNAFRLRREGVGDVALITELVWLDKFPLIDRNLSPTSGETVSKLIESA